MKSWVLCEPRQILSLLDRQSSFDLVLVAGCAKFRSPYQNLEIADYGDFCVLGWCAPRSTSRGQGDKSLVGFPMSGAILCGDDSNSSQKEQGFSAQLSSSWGAHTPGSAWRLSKGKRSN